MSALRALLLTGVLLLAVVLQVSVFSGLSFDGVVPNLALLVVVAAALVRVSLSQRAASEVTASVRDLSRSLNGCSLAPVTLTRPCRMRPDTVSILPVCCA